jgi:branched-subunit amino acid aminotransferase/4-amino-4-deoxychorismate lyase
MAAHYIQANTNGRLHPAAEASVSPVNRGFLYGDAVYEVWRTYDGVIFAWEGHWRRLLGSAEALFMAVPFSEERMLAEIRRTVAAYRQAVPSAGELYVRLQITRGEGSIGLDVALAEAPGFVILIQPCPLLPPAQLEQGLRLSIARSLRRNPIQALSPGWKTGNYLNNILCLREARQRGADEVLILNLEGGISEAAVSNLAFIRDGEVLTPPVEAGILAGITRAELLTAVAPAAGVRVREVALRPEDLPGMSECFLLSTTKDLVPVGAIDEVRFRTGPDTLTRRLKATFAAHAAAYAKAHPGLKLF